jgi:four helix bundle protein
MFGFEKLEVWREAVQYANFVYSMTKAFPADERFGLTSQLRRSAVSISANLAEGTSRMSSKDSARFVEISYGSLMENISEAMIAKEQGLLPDSQFQELYQKAETIGRMLSGLRSSLISDKPSTLNPHPSTAA